MYRSVAVALLLINAYSGSLGAPTPKVGIYLERNNLTELANRCTNQFLSTQIKSKISECNIYEPKTEKEFQCNIFYDINTQLCDAIVSSKLSISKIEEDKLNVEVGIDQFCQEIKNYKSTNSTYEMKAEKVFEHNSSCIKSCGTDDTTNMYTSYYCKYYKWGKDLLESSQNMTPSPPIQPIVLNTTHLPKPKDIQDVPEKVVPSDTQLIINNNKGFNNSVTSTVHISSTNVAKSEIPTSIVEPPVEAEQKDENIKEIEQDDKDDPDTNNGGEYLQ